MTSAPYRFVPISPKVVEPPIPLANLDLSKPKDGCLSGEITVTWTAKTPICVGEQPQAGTAIGGQQGGGEVLPINISGRYCLPGPSLRGMIRSIVEIASHSHLGRINHWRQHGMRDFSRRKMPRGLGYNANEVKAGWIFLDDGTWQLKRKSDEVSPSWYLVHFNEIISRLPGIGAADWRGLSVARKRGLLHQAKLLGPQQLVETGANANGHLVARFAAAGETPNLRGYLVCPGAIDAPGNGVPKWHEALFAGTFDEQMEICDRVMEKFIRLHSEPGRRRATDCGPRENWHYWLQGAGALGDHRPEDGIPVFYVGTPGQPDFFFGLSRVIRLPWKHDVGQVAEHVYDPANPPSGRKYRVPRLPPPRTADGTVPPDPDADKGWDFARAMFGWVEDWKHDGRRADPDDKTSRALAGRVAFGFAWAPQDTQPLPTVASGVLGAPRESFYPFYLTRKDPQLGGPTGATYDDDFAIPAGRKRYVVRESITRNEVRLPQPPAARAGEAPADVTTRVRFLPAGTTFEGAIRFQGLHAAELGALLWALTFGEPDAAKRRHRHQIGRAKAHDAGVLSADVKLTRMEEHAAPGTATLSTRSVADCMAMFEGHMQKALGLPPGQRLAETPSVKALLMTAHPEVGRRAEAAGELGNLPLEPQHPAHRPPTPAEKQRTYPGQKKLFDAGRIANPRTDRNLLPPLSDT